MLIRPTSLTHSSRRRAGWTLVEMMVAVAASGIMLAAFVCTTITISRTMVAVGNYRDLNQDSRETLDYLSMDVRNASSVGSTSTSTYLVLTNSYYNAVITYWWDSGTTAFKRNYSVSSGSTTTTLLTNCDTFAFAYYQRNPAANLDFVPTSTTSQIKLISVSWRCSRQILGATLNTESVQTAKVVMRN